MEVTVLFSHNESGMRLSDRFALGDRISAAVRRLRNDKALATGSHFSDGEWYVSPADAGLLRDVRECIERLLPERCKPCYEIVTLSDFMDEYGSASHFMFPYIGDDASGCDDCDSAEVGYHVDSLVKCPDCGNEHQSLAYPLRVRGRRLPKSKELFTFYGELSVFCRESFVQKASDCGLTGLEFPQIPLERTEGTPLFRVKPHLHRWQDRSGVCEGCGMKTNVRGVQMFNLPEEYGFDVQVARLFDGHLYVLSRKALECISGACHITFEKTCFGPIRPGYMAGLLRPEDKVFRFGEAPTRVVNPI